MDNWESYATGVYAVFQHPAYSGSTTGINAGDTAAVSNESANNILDPNAGTPGTQSYKVTWQWTVAGTGYIRLTTANTANKPNPLLDLTKGLSLYLNLPAGQIDLQLMIRETGGSGPIGANGGQTGTIEKTATAKRINSSGGWQYVYFNIPNETWTGFTGNGILEGTWGTLEALAITAVSSDPTTAFTLYLDDIYQGPQQTPQSLKVYVNSITMSSGRSGSNYYARATVWIKNSSGANISGATVTGQWSGAVSGASSGATGADGKVILQSPNKKNGGTFNFCVTNVVATGYTYDSAMNIETCDSITAP